VSTVHVHFHVPNVVYGKTTVKFTQGMKIDTDKDMETDTETDMDMDTDYAHVHDVHAHVYVHAIAMSNSMSTPMSKTVSASPVMPEALIVFAVMFMFMSKFCPAYLNGLLSMLNFRIGNG
jgi:hypothetical protein